MNELLERLKIIDIKIKLLVLLVLCIAAGYYGYEDWISTAQSAYDAAKLDAEKMDEEIVTVSKAGQSIVAIEAELRKSDAEISGLLELLPMDSELDRVLGYFATAAKETGIEMREFLPGEDSASKAAEAEKSAISPAPANAQTNPPKKDEVPPTEKASPAKVLPVNTTKLKVTLIGTFPQIVSFFDSTLSMPRILKIESYTMKSEQKDAKTFVRDPKLLVEVNYVAYYQKLNTPIENLASKATLASTPQGSEQPAGSVKSPVLGPTTEPAKVTPPGAASNSDTAIAVPPAAAPNADTASAPPPAALSAKPLGKDPSAE